MGTIKMRCAKDLYLRNATACNGNLVKRLEDILHGPAERIPQRSAGERERVCPSLLLENLQGDAHIRGKHVRPRAGPLAPLYEGRAAQFEKYR